jgi:hypothetical protein
MRSTFRIEGVGSSLNRLEYSDTCGLGRLPPEMPWEQQSFDFRPLEGERASKPVVVNKHCSRQTCSRLT